MSLSLRIAVACALVSSVVAQSHSDDAVHLDDFVVSTHPYARSQSEIAQPTSVLGGDKLDQNQTTSLGELLANQPGVSSTYFGPGASRPIIRALGGPRVTVLQNGTDTIDASAISPDHAVSIDPLLIERVEITRGPAALLQGGAAIGGAVNVVTHRIHTSPPEAGVHGRTEGRLASGNDERSGGLVLEGGTGAFAWHADVFSRRTGDLSIPGHAESAWLRAQEADEHHDDDEDHHEDEADHDEDHEDHEEAIGFVPNSAVKTDGGAFGLTWFGDNAFVGVAVSGLDSRYGIPPGAHVHEHENDESHAEEEEAPVQIDLRQRRLDLESEWREPVAAIRAIRLKAAHADYRHIELEGDEIGTVFNNTGYDVRVDVLHEPWGALQGAVGIKVGATDFTAVGEEAFLPPTTSRETALYLFEEIEAGANLWQLGARSEWRSIKATDGSGLRDSGQAISTSLGWVHTLNDTWSLAASLARTERLPTSQELFADGPHIGTNAYEVGDSALNAERSIGLDLTLRRSGRFVGGEITVFANQFDGYIYENPTGTEMDGLPVYAFVQRDARFHGAEAKTVFHLHNDEHGHLDLTIGGDLVKARNTTDDRHLPRTTPARLRAGMDWARNGWRAGTELARTFTQDEIAPGETPTSGHTLISAYLGYRWTPGRTTYDLLLLGTNLGDSEARSHTSFLKESVPLPGRSFACSFRASF